MVGFIKIILYSLCYTLSQKYGKYLYLSQGRRKLFIYGNLVMMITNMSLGSISMKMNSLDTDDTLNMYL